MSKEGSTGAGVTKGAYQNASPVAHRSIVETARTGTFNSRFVTTSKTQGTVTLRATTRSIAPPPTKTAK